MSLFLVSLAHTVVTAKTVDAESPDAAFHKAATDNEPGLLLHSYVADVHVKQVSGDDES
jgi:hypothetical protein